ncbi:response regulator [bacterium]|nr:response regulator [bacterium]
MNHEKNNTLKRHILVADVDPNFLKTIEFLLEVRNYQVSLVNSGYDALVLLEKANQQESAIDLLITGIFLPGLSGLDLIDAINYYHFKTSVVVISGMLTERLKYQIRVRGVTACFSKPFDENDLLRQVSLLLSV